MGARTETSGWLTAATADRAWEDRAMETPADELIRTLGLVPHPEGGHYVETSRSDDSSAIYFLLRAGEVSHWHRIRAAETWHHYAGASLELATWNEGDPAITRRTLGPDVVAGERPQLVVGPHEWQSARPLGDWTLVGCTVAPPFDFAEFELAPPEWSPRPGAGSPDPE